MLACLVPIGSHDVSVLYSFVPPWAQRLSPQLPWHLLGHRNPLFFGCHFVAQEFLQSCAQSLKTGCLTTSPWNCPNRRAHSPPSSTHQHLCSPPFPKQSPPLPGPRESSFNQRENSLSSNPILPNSTYISNLLDSSQGLDFRNQSYFFLLSDTFSHPSLVAMTLEDLLNQVGQ